MVIPPLIDPVLTIVCFLSVKFNICFMFVACVQQVVPDVTAWCHHVADVGEKLKSCMIRNYRSVLYLYDSVFARDALS